MTRMSDARKLMLYGLRNAAAGLAYIGLIIAVIQTLDKTRIPDGVPEIIGIFLVLSMLVTSVLAEGFFLLVQPLLMLAAGKHKEALKLFGWTAISFVVLAIATVSVVIILVV